MGRPKGRSVVDTGKTNAPTIIRNAMKARGYTQVMLAERLGYASQSGISGVIGGNNIQVNVLLSILDELGFDIIVRDRNGSNRENTWRIERIAETPTED